MLKRLLIAALITVLVFAAASFLVPDMRITLWGARFNYKFDLESEQVGWIITLTQDQEVRGPGQTDAVKLGDGHNLSAQLVEKVESRGSEVVVGYEVGETRAESMNSKPGPNLSGSHLQVRVLPRGGVAASQSFARVDSPLLRDTALQTAFGSLWPRLPDGWSRPGRPSWSASYSSEIKDRLLDQPVRLDHKLTYTLDRFFEDSGLSLAEIRWTGTVDVTGGTGKGTVKGSCFYDLNNGKCVTGVYEVEQEFVAPLKTLPGNMSLAWRQAQHGQYFRLKAGREATPTPAP